MPSDYTPEVWQTGDQFSAGDATQISQQLNEEEEINVAQQAAIDALGGIVTPETFGAVGDGTTDNAAALQAMFDSATTNGGACILIPYGKVYASADTINVKSNTYIFGAGTLKCLSNDGGPGAPGGFFVIKDSARNITWTGPTVDINHKTDVNGFDVGDIFGDFGTGDYVADIHIEGRVIGTRVDAALEDTNNMLYSGGGKGITVQFCVRNLYANIIADDCDIACSVEGDSGGKQTENVVLDIRSINSHRTALFIAGTRDGAFGSLDSGNYLDSIYPGCKIRLRASGGQDASITHPVTGVVGTNYSNAGVVTLNSASGIDLEVYAAVANRCTLVRGMATSSTIRITNALMDNVEDVWDTRPLDTLSPFGTYMPDNVFTANVHATTHSGVVVRPHRSSGTKTMVKTRLDVNMWCANGVGLVTQSDGTTDGFGTSVNYRFCDMKADPIKEIVGHSNRNAFPTWAQAAGADHVSSMGMAAKSFIPIADSTATAAGTTTLDATSAQVQVFTGTTTQTVKLPSTGVFAGQSFTLVNQSTSNLTIQASNASGITALWTTRIGVFTALIDTPSTSADWVITGWKTTTGDTANSLMMRDSDHNVFANDFIVTSASTATAGGTTTLAYGDSPIQVFTGTAAQTVKLPSSFITAGQQYTIINNGTNTVSVQSSAANAITTVTTNSLKLFVTLVDTPTTAAHWRAI